METKAEERRLFTLAEANALLPQVRERIDALQAQAARLAELHDQMESFRQQKRGGVAVDGESHFVRQVLEEVNRLTGSMQEGVGALLALGCELKDVRQGLVDFPTRREERVVYLCWRAGEDEIRFWHELDTGFAGRQPL